MDTVQVRDRRQAGWCWINNTVLDNYGETLEAYGLAVYLSLARWADNHNGQCWPRVATIAAKCGISDSSVRRAIERLERLDLIEVIDVIEANGAQGANVYVLLAPGQGPAPDWATRDRPARRLIDRRHQVHNTPPILRTGGGSPADTTPPIPQTDLQKETNTQSTKSAPPVSKDIDAERLARIEQAARYTVKTPRYVPLRPGDVVAIGLTAPTSIDLDELERRPACRALARQCRERLNIPDPRRVAG